VPDDPERLWSPWRMTYIRGGDSDQPGGCLFCDLPAAGQELAETYQRLRPQLSDGGAEAVESPAEPS
jgi:hypothetical protein